MDDNTHTHTHTHTQWYMLKHVRALSAGDVEYADFIFEEG